MEDNIKCGTTSIEYNDLHIVNKNSDRKHKPCTPSDLLWVSGTSTQWNEIYNTLCNKLPNAIRANNIEAKLGVLDRLHSATLKNVIVVQEFVSLLRANINDVFTLKRLILKHLPVIAITFPVFTAFKPVQFVEYLTLQNFPDNNPTAHWFNLINFMVNYNYKLLTNNANNRDKIALLIKKQLQSAQSTNNRAAILLIKQIAEELFGPAFVKKVLKIRKVSAFRLNEYKVANKLLLQEDAATKQAIDKYDKRLINKQNQLLLMDDEYESDLADEIREQNIITRKHLESKIKHLKKHKNNIIKRSANYKIRKNKKMVRLQQCRLKSEVGAVTKCDKNAQMFMSLSLQQCINQPQDQVLAHSKRAHSTSICGSSTATTRHLLTCNNIWAAYVENGETDPVAALNDYQSKSPSERREFLLKCSFQKGITSMALVNLYGKDKNKNKNVLKACERLWQWGEIHKSIKGPDHLNKDLCRETENNLHQWHLIQDQYSDQCITVVSDDCSVQRHDHNTTNNCRETKMLLSMADPSETQSSIRKRFGYKTSSAPKDQIYQFLQSSVCEVLLGTSSINDNGTVTAYNRVGNKQFHGVVVAPKSMHKGNNGEAKSIWVHIQMRDNGKSDKHLLYWKGDQFINWPKQFKKDLLLYFTIIRNGSFLLKYAKLALKYLESKHKGNVCIIFFIIMYFAKNSIVMGLKIYNLVNNEENQSIYTSLTRTNHQQIDIILQLSEHIITLKELSLNLLFLLNIKESVLDECDCFHAKRYEVDFIESFQWNDDRNEEFVKQFDLLQPIIKSILDMNEFIKICEFREYENDFHDGGQPGNEKKEKIATDILYVLCTQKKVFESAQNAGNDSASQASEKLNAATQHYSRKIISSHAPQAFINRAAKDRYAMNGNEFDRALFLQQYDDMYAICDEWVGRVHQQKAYGTPIYASVFPEKKKTGFTMLFPPLFQAIIDRGKTSSNKKEAISSKLFKDLIIIHKEHTITNYKIRTTYHHLGCKYFNGLLNCTLNHINEDLNDATMKLCPSPIIIPRENGCKYMKYEPLDINKDLLHYGKEQHNAVNPYRDFQKLFKENISFSYRNDLSRIQHINPTLILQWRSPNFTAKTKDIIQRFYESNPARLSSLESFWIRKLKGKQTANAVHKIIDNKIIEELKQDWLWIQRHSQIITSIDTSKTNQEIKDSLEIGRFRSILEDIADETDTEDIATIKAVIILIQKRLNKEKIDKEKKIVRRAQIRAQNERKVDSDSDSTHSDSDSTQSDTGSDSQSDADSTDSSESVDIDMILIDGQYQFV